jgi:hypothetical protein
LCDRAFRPQFRVLFFERGVGGILDDVDDFAQLWQWTGGLQVALIAGRTKWAVVHD